MGHPADEPAFSRARRVAALVFLATCALSLGELAVWRFGHYAVDTAPVLLATAIVATLAAIVTCVVAWVPPSRADIAVVLVFGPLTTWFARHWLDAILPPSTNLLAWSIAAAAAIPVTLVLRWLARSPRGVPAVAAVALILGLASAVPRPRPIEVRADAPSDAPDIFLLVLDTTRRDALSVFGNPRGTTPYLDRLARRSIVYSDAWSAAPWTAPSHASMFSGRLPADHGVEGSPRPEFPDDIATLPEVLRASGYATAGFFANPLLDARGWSRGFQEYRPPWMRGRHTLPRFWIGHSGLQGRWKESAHATLQLSERWWRDHGDAPRFLFVNLIDPHDPYEPLLVDRRRYVRHDEEALLSITSQDSHDYYLKDRLTPQKAAVLRALYDAEVAGMDRELGRFFQRLDLDEELDDAVVAIASDHGERIGEFGALGHNLTMDPYVLEIPLVVHRPTPAPTGLVSRRVASRYLPSYLSELAGIDGHPFGRPERLREENAPYLVAQLRETTWFIDQLLARDPTFDDSPYRGDRCFVTDGEYAYRRILGEEPANTLIHLLFDPEWENDLEMALPEVAERFDAIVETLPPFGDTASEDIDPAARKRLRALGYVD
jgi:arylsulfatase A-like enzyme